MRDERARHFLNDVVVGATGLNGACVIALQGNTARNAREGHIIKTSTTDRLLMLFFITWLATVWPPCTQVLFDICHTEYSSVLKRVLAPSRRLRKNEMLKKKVKNKPQLINQVLSLQSSPQSV